MDYINLPGVFVCCSVPSRPEGALSSWDVTVATTPAVVEDGDNDGKDDSGEDDRDKEDDGDCGDGDGGDGE